MDQPLFKLKNEYLNINEKFSSLLTAANTHLNVNKRSFKIINQNLNDSVHNRRSVRKMSNQYFLKLQELYYILLKFFK